MDVAPYIICTSTAIKPLYLKRNTEMNNIQIINLIGYAVNSDVLERLESNEKSAINSWSSDIQDAIDSKSSHFEVSSRYSKSGNPVLVRL